MDRNLEIAAAASLGGLAGRRRRRAAKPGELLCANCGTPLAGAYCHACGQLAEDFERSIGALLIEVFENLFHTDGRLLRNLPRLAIDPAGLTRDYLAGRRASQMPPLRLFLVVVLLFSWPATCVTSPSLRGPCRWLWCPPCWARIRRRTP